MIVSGGIGVITVYHRVERQLERDVCCMMIQRIHAQRRSETSPGALSSCDNLVFIDPQFFCMAQDIEKCVMAFPYSLRIR